MSHIHRSLYFIALPDASVAANQRFVDVDLGVDHVCAVTKTGAVECYGTTKGAPEAVAVPSAVSAGTSGAVANGGVDGDAGSDGDGGVGVERLVATEVAVTLSRACVLTNQHKVACWNIGDGNRVKVVTYDNDTYVTLAATGIVQTPHCAITSAMRAVCAFHSRVGEANDDDGDNDSDNGNLGDLFGPNGGLPDASDADSSTCNADADDPWDPRWNTKACREKLNGPGGRRRLLNSLSHNVDSDDNEDNGVDNSLTRRRLLRARGRGNGVLSPPRDVRFVSLSSSTNMERGSSSKMCGVTDTGDIRCFDDGFADASKVVTDVEKGRSKGPFAQVRFCFRHVSCQSFVSSFVRDVLCEKETFFLPFVPFF
jgi:hypothetical protein